VAAPRVFTANRRVLQGEAGAPHCGLSLPFVATWVGAALGCCSVGLVGPAAGANVPQRGRGLVPSGCQHRCCGCAAHACSRGGAEKRTGGGWARWLRGKRPPHVLPDVLVAAVCCLCKCQCLHIIQTVGHFQA
jgi:hypothetical protein